MLIGHNFPANVTPVCRFGVPGKFEIVKGTLLSDRKVSCISPPIKIPKVAQIPYMVPVSLGFEKEGQGTESFLFSYLILFKLQVGIVQDSTFHTMPNLKLLVSNQDKLLLTSQL